jgi:hypothetical protein
MGFNDYRRPSEPNSMASLLPTGPQSSLSLNSYPTMSTYIYGQPDLANSLPHHQHQVPPSAIPVPYSPALSTPPRSITVSRTHSFSTGSTVPGRSSLSATFAPSAPVSGTQTAPATEMTTFQFDTNHPFGSARGQPRGSLLTPITAGNESEGDRPGMRPRMMSFEDMLEGPRTGGRGPS